MKEFPLKVDGPLGPWYKKVNAAVSQINLGNSKERRVQLLGDPDESRGGSIHPEKQRQEMMEDLAGKSTHIRYGSKETFDEILIYIDPYRPWKRYAIGIANALVVEAWPETIERKNRSTNYSSGPLKATLFAVR